MRDEKFAPHRAMSSAPVAMTVMMDVRAGHVVVAAHMVRAMPAMMTAHMMMAVAVVVMAAILHLGRQTFTCALHGCGNAGIVERDRIGPLGRRGHEHQAGDGGEAEKLFQVHVFSPGFRGHLNVSAARGSLPMHEG